MKNISGLFSKQEKDESQERLLAVKIPPSLFERLSKITMSLPKGMTKRKVVLAMLSDGCDEFDRQKKDAKAAEKAA